MMTSSGEPTFHRLGSRYWHHWGLLGLAILVWGCVGTTVYRATLFFSSLDDFPRLVLAMQWADDPFFAVEDVYWLPLPVWLQGLWYRFAGAGIGLYWHVPLSIALISLAGFFSCLAAIRLTPIDARRDRSGFWWIALLTLILPLLAPFNWRLATSGLSEPIDLLLQALAICGLIAALKTAQWATWIRLGIVLILWQMTRYEAIVLGYLIWTLATLGSPFAPLRNSLKRRGLILLAGWAGLALFPATWLLLNYLEHGEAFHFMGRAREQANAALMSMAPLARLGWLGELSWISGKWLMLLTGLGIVAGFRDRSARWLTGFWAACVLLFFWTGWNKTLGVIAPQRFVLNYLWAGLPLAALGYWFWIELIRERVRAGGLLRVLQALPILIMGGYLGFAIPQWKEGSWGGEYLNPGHVRQLESFAQLIDREDYLAVVEDMGAFGERDLNILRYNVGPSRIVLEAWLIDPPETYLYFPSEPSESLSSRWRTILKHPYVIRNSDSLRGEN